MAGADMPATTESRLDGQFGALDRAGGPRWGAAKRLSDRTPLRTKLITAVLALVIMALAAISFASVYMLRCYVTTQHDTAPAMSGLQQPHRHGRLQPAATSTAGPPRRPLPNVVVGLQQSGHQLSLGARWQQPVPRRRQPRPRLAARTADQHRLGQRRNPGRC